MKRTIVLNNLKRKQYLIFEQPLHQVYFESFHYHEANLDDEPFFMFIWPLVNSPKTICQYYNWRYRLKPGTKLPWSPHDPLQRLRFVRRAQEPFYSIVLELGRPFKSDTNALIIRLNIPVDAFSLN